MERKEGNDHTRDRLLNEAETLFARKGYHAVSIREITSAADSNIAAVNYHFGNKHNLYLDVFRLRIIPRAMRVKAYFERSIEGEKPLDPATCISALARAFIEGPLTDEERQRQLQLMTKEISQPTEAFDLLADRVMKPFIGKVIETLGPFMDRRDDPEKVVLNVMSVFFMVIHINFARNAVTRVTGREYDDEFRERLVRHIQEFALYGVGLNGEEA
jgi:AcrR family transcriptional regulator